MNKLLLTFSVFVSLSAFAMGHRAPTAPIPTASPIPVASVEPTPSPSPTAPPTGQMITVGKISGATAEEVRMILQGEKLANDMLKKPCFAQWVLAARYTENEGLTQAQILNKVLTEPSVIDVEMYTGTWYANHKSKTVGYENDPFDGVVHMNRYFVNSAYMVADNLIHEDRGHSLGFHHYGNHSTSVPYGQNYAFEGCSQQAMQAKGAKTFKPPGLKLEIRSKDKKTKRGSHK